ncbi:MAG: sel1 repeat family protein [Victivallales bacterium]|nr:sel1 repeat family protein [Victivallales bacterium]
MNAISKIVAILNVVLLVLIWKVCHPTKPDRLLEISEILKIQPVSFISASDYYSRKAMANDSKLAGLDGEIDTLIEQNDFEQAFSLIRRMAGRYPLYTKASTLREKVEKAKADFIAKKTNEAIEHYGNDRFDKAFDAVEYADSSNPRVSFILGMKHLRQEKDEQGKFEAGEKALLYAAQNGVAEAFFELGKLYDPTGKAWRTSMEKAKSWYMKAFENGTYEAGLYLANMLEKAGDVKGAFGWISKTAEHDVLEAQRLLALMYKEGRGVTRNIEKAIQFYEVVANQNDVDAMLALGVIYGDRQSEVFNYSIAFEWFMKAAEEENDRAQLVVAIMYEKGLGIEKNLFKAKVWYEKAAKNGSKEAKEWLGKNLERIRREESERKRQVNYRDRQVNYVAKAVEEWEMGKCKEAIFYAKLADQNNPHIQGMLAYAHYYGAFGLDRNQELAVELAHSAARGSDPWGYLVLAKYNGTFPDSNGWNRSSQEYIKQCVYYEKAAQGGIDVAQCKVAELCIYGRGFDDGVTTLRSKKKRLFRSRNHSVASDDPYTTCFHDYEKAKYWLERAYAQGSVEAAEMLCMLYCIGYGEPGQAGCGFQGANCFGSIPRNVEKALALIKWLEKRDAARANKLRLLLH